MIYPEIENKKLEFKAYLEDYTRFCESIVAFANTQGGEIIIGIRDRDRLVMGLDDDLLYKYHEELPQIVSDMISPQFQIELFEKNIDDKICMVARIYPGPHCPYFVKSRGYPKGVFLRMGAHNRPADEYALLDLEREKSGKRYEEKLCHNIQFEMLEPDSLKLIFGNVDPTKYISSGYGTLISRQKICSNVAGVLLFFKEHTKVISESNVTVTQYAGIDNTNIIKRESFSNGLIQQFEASFEYIKEITGRNYKLIHQVMAPTAYEYPLNAIREILINAIVHRAYDYETPIRISLFSNRIEVLNPGFFYAPIDENTLMEGLSRYRNPMIASAFRKVGYMEKQGIGIRKIISECEKAGLRQPIFLEPANHVKVTIFNKKILDQAIEKQITNLPDEYLNHFLNEEKISSSRFAQLIGKSPSTAKNILRDLKEKNIIQARGYGRSTYYALAKDQSH
jgi:ATP-dependent DNA helicase RecG